MTMNPLLMKLLGRARLLAPAGGGDGGGGMADDVLNDDFDESVLDKDDVAEHDGSNFEATDDDPEDEEPKGRKPEKKPEPKKPEPKKGEAEDDPEEDDPEEDPEEGALKKLAKGKDEPEEGGEEKKRVKGKMIPLDRHNQILARERARREAAEAGMASFQGARAIEVANAKTAELEAQLPALEEEYNKLLADGKAAEATAKFREIRKLDAEIADSKARAGQAVAAARAVEQERFNTALKRVESAYPVLDEDHDDYDPERMKAVTELMEFYQSKGKTPTEAMQLAVAREMGAPKTAAQFEAQNVKPRVKVKEDPEEDPEEDDPEEEADPKAQRKAKQVDKNLRVKQPPSTDKVGLSHNKLGKSKGGPKDILKMSDEEFDKLTDEELAEMGGDRRMVAEQDD